MLTAWEEEYVLPLLLSNKPDKIIQGCDSLINDDTGDVDELAVVLAEQLKKYLTK